MNVTRKKAEPVTALLTADVVLRDQEGAFYAKAGDIQVVSEADFLMLKNLKRAVKCPQDLLDKKRAADAAKATSATASKAKEPAPAASPKSQAPADSGAPDEPEEDETPAEDEEALSKPVSKRKKSKAQVTDSAGNALTSR